MIDIESHEPIVQETAIDGIALTPDGSGGCKFYYCPISSLSVYEVPCAVLRNESLATDVGAMDEAITEFASEIYSIARYFTG